MRRCRNKFPRTDARKPLSLFMHCSFAGAGPTGEDGGQRRGGELDLSTAYVLDDDGGDLPGTVPYGLCYRGGGMPVSEGSKVADGKGLGG